MKFTITIDRVTLFVTIGALQLTLRQADSPDETRQRIAAFKTCLQETLRNVAPELYAMTIAADDPNRDDPRGH